MKTMITCFFLALVLSSCDPNADKQIGRMNRPANTSGSNGNGGGSANVGGVGGAGSGSATTDAPIDGGLGALLVAGAACGLRRVRAAKQKASTRTGA